MFEGIKKEVTVQKTETVKFSCAYCGADGSWNEIIGPVMPVEKQEIRVHPGNWEEKDVAEHIMEQHAEKVLEELARTKEELHRLQYYCPEPRSRRHPFG